MNKDEAKSMLVAWIILGLIVGAALLLGSSSPNAPADPQCVASGNC